MRKSLLVLSSESVNFEPISRLSDTFFDDVNKKVCTVRAGGAMGVTARGPTSRDVFSFQLADKGPFFSMKLSPDGKVVAAQRSPAAVTFVNIENGAADTVEYAQTCKGKNARIIGIEWTGASEIVFVTDCGLELHQVLMDKRMVRSIKYFKLPIMWFVYSPETRVLVASTGKTGAILQPFLITDGNITPLAKFETEVDPTALAAGKLTLFDRDVCVNNVYGLSYAMVLRHTGSGISNTDWGSVVNMYLLHKDSISIPPRKLHVLQLGSMGKFAIHVIDDLIVVHQQASKNSLVFDIRAPGISDGTITIHKPLAEPVAITLPDGGISTDPNSCYDPAVELYANAWRVFLPDIIIDPHAGCMWRLKLSLGAACELLDDRCSLIEFLLRRVGSKTLLLDVLLDSLSKQKVSLIETGKIWDVFCNIFKIHTEACAKGVESSAKVVVDQSDIYNFVFIPMLDGCSELTAYDWIAKVMLEYLLSLQQRDIMVQPFLHELLVKSLVKAEQFQKLHQLVQYGVVIASKPLAFLLLSLETQYPAALQLATDMLGRADAAAEEIVEILLSKQKIVDAIRYAQSCGVLERISPLKFVEAAWQTQNNHVRYTTYRFFEQRTIRLRGTPQFSRGEQFDQFTADYQRLKIATCDQDRQSPTGSMVS